MFLYREKQGVSVFLMPIYPCFYTGFRAASVFLTDLSVFLYRENWLKLPYLQGLGER